MSPRSVPAARSGKPTVWTTHKQLRARYGERGELYIPRLIESAGFPKPYRFGSGRLLFWKLEEVEAWEAAQAQRVA
jgi:hypothetical protein